jgi:hypothetical protein
MSAAVTATGLQHTTGVVVLVLCSSSAAMSDAAGHELGLKGLSAFSMLHSSMPGLCMICMAGLASSSTVRNLRAGGPVFRKI